MTTGLTGKSTRRPSERVFTEPHVDSLLAHPLNGKLYGTLAADEKFVESIKEFGVLEPILTARMSFNDGESYEDYVISGQTLTVSGRGSLVRRYASTSNETERCTSQAKTRQQHKDFSGEERSG
jgi:hypothetical protein